MSDIQLTRAIPVLPAREIGAASGFYRDVLGFAVAFEMGDYSGVTRGPIELHLDASAPPAGSVSARIDVVGVDALYAAIEPSGAVKPDERLETKPWGLRQFSVLDPAGNRVTFAKGAALPDPSRLFNSSLEGNTRRALDIREGDDLDAAAFKALVREAVALNGAATKKPAKKKPAKKAARKAKS